MPAEKTTRQAMKRAARNRGVRTYTRTTLRSARSAIDERDPESETLMRQAMSALDKAVKKGVIHKNSASRRKARLAARLNKVRAGA